MKMSSQSSRQPRIAAPTASISGPTDCSSFRTGMMIESMEGSSRLRRRAAIRCHSFEYVERQTRTTLPTVAPHPFQSGGGNGRAADWVEEQVLDLLRDLAWIVWINEHRAVAGNLAEPVGAGCDDGHAARHRFGDRNRKCLEIRRIKIEIRERKHGRKIFLADPARE